MSAERPFFDTNLLLYAYTGKGDPRAATAKKLLEEGGTIGVQQLNEFVAVARRKLKQPWTEVCSALHDLRFFCPDPVPMTAAVHERGVRIAHRYGYGIFDSLVIAAALGASCTLLYSEDMQDGQTVGGLHICNPFRTVEPSRPRRPRS